MKAKWISLLFLISVMAYSLKAQQTSSRFGVELNTGASFPVQKLNGQSLNPGFGFEALVHYRFLPRLGFYAGWGWNRMASDASEGLPALDFEETGYIFGLEYHQPLNESAVSLFLRAGGLYNHIETEEGNNIIHDTRHGLGYQVACGVTIPMGSHWILVPGIKFNSLSRTNLSGDEEIQRDYQYLQLRVGIIRHF